MLKEVVLEKLPPAQREVIASLWQTENDPAAIVAQMRNTIAARFVWQAFSKDEQDCLYHVLSASKGIKREALRRKTKRPLQAVEQALARLKVLHLVTEDAPPTPIPLSRSPRETISEGVPIVQAYPECQESLRQVGQELFSSGANRATMDLSHLIERQPWETVEAQGSIFRVKRTYLITAPYLRGDYCDQIATAMTSSLTVFEVLHHTGAAAQRLYWWLCEHDGCATLAQVQEFLQESDDRLLVKLLTQMEQQGLVFSTLTTEGAFLVFIHQAVFASIQQAALERRADERRYAFVPLDEEPSMQQEHPPTLLYDLATIIWWVYHHSPIEPTKAQRLPKRLVAKIRPMLHCLPRYNETGEDQYTDLLFNTARSLELLLCSTPEGEEQARYLPGPRLPQWSAMSLPQQIHTFLSWWSGKTLWIDLKADGKPINSYDWSAYNARQLLLNQLQRCQKGRWYAVEILMYAIWSQSPQSGSTEPHRQRASLRTQRKKWLAQNHPLYSGLLTSTLAELGLIVLGYQTTFKADDGTPTLPDRVRVTELGAVVFGPSDTPAPSKRGALTVQPNYDVLLFEPEMAMLYTLLLFAEIKNIERVSSLRLSRATLLRGMATGLSVEQMIDFLEQSSLHPLPQNVVYTLRDWGKEYRDARLSEVLLIELANDDTLIRLKQALAEKHIELRTVAAGIHLIAAEQAMFTTIRRVLEHLDIVVHGQSAHRTPRRE